MIVCESGMNYLREELGDDFLYINVIVGPARKGKSFFMNNLAKGLSNSEGNGFSVGHSAAGHTKGFWINREKEKKYLETSSGEKVVSIFMDTEGFGAIGNLNSYDPKLCAIATIFASNLFYNVMSEISMDNIQFLSSIASFDDFFIKKHNISYPTPPLTWTVQNWEFSLDEYNPPNELGYLKYVLQEKDITKIKENNKDDHKKLLEYNLLLKKIEGKFMTNHNTITNSRSYDDDAIRDQDIDNTTSLIQELDGVTFDNTLHHAPKHASESSSSAIPPIPPIILLDHPSPHTKRKDMTKLLFHEYQPSYQQQILYLSSLILQNAAPKAFLKNQYLTGKSLADNMKSLIQALNQLTEVGDALVKTIANEVKTLALQRYTQQTKDITFPTSSFESFVEQLLSIESDIFLYYDNNILGDNQNTINLEYKQQLLNQIKSERKIVITQSYNSILHYCSKESKVHETNLKLLINEISKFSQDKSNGLNRLYGPQVYDNADDSYNNENYAVKDSQENRSSSRRHKHGGGIGDDRMAVISQLCFDTRNYNNTNSTEESIRLGLNVLPILETCYANQKAKYESLCGPQWCVMDMNKILSALTSTSMASNGYNNNKKNNDRNEDEAYLPTICLQCQESATNSFNDYIARMDSIYNSQKSLLSNNGFHTLLSHLFLSYLLLRILVLLGLYFHWMLFLMNNIYYALSILLFLSLMEGVKWLQYSMCHQDIIDIDLIIQTIDHNQDMEFSEICEWVSNEGPRVIGENYNAILIYVIIALNELVAWKKEIMTIYSSWNINQQLNVFIDRYYDMARMWNQTNINHSQICEYNINGTIAHFNTLTLSINNYIGNNYNIRFKVDAIQISHIVQHDMTHLCTCTLRSFSYFCDAYQIQEIYVYTTILMIIVIFVFILCYRFWCYCLYPSPSSSGDACKGPIKEISTLNDIEILKARLKELEENEKKMRNAAEIYKNERRGKEDRTSSDSNDGYDCDGGAAKGREEDGL